MVIELKITTMKHDIMVEIRDAEGGSDSKLLVKDMGDIYIRAAKSKEFN